MTIQHKHVKESGIIRTCSVFLSGLILSLVLTTPGYAEDNDEGLGGDEFRKTALDYENRASKYAEKGMSDIANIYTRMAEIKRDAARLADQGKWDDIDWSEYKTLDAKLNKIYESKKHKKK